LSGGPDLRGAEAERRNGGADSRGAGGERGNGGADGEHRNGGADGEHRNETHLERLDRNLGELTGELRVVVTGVQVLFAFLLIVPFDPGFAHVGAFERIVYLVTLVLAALAAVCTITPSAEHRFLFRHDDKQHIVFRSNRVVIGGLVLLALAMCGCLMLVTTKLFGVTAGALAAGIGALPFAILWFAGPIARLRALERQTQSGASSRPSAEAAGGGRR